MLSGLKPSRSGFLVSASGSTTRRPAQASLLFPDVPLPDGSTAERLEANVGGGWRYRETNSLSDPAATMAMEWFQREAASRGWTFERTEPADEGSGLVFARGGEELWLEFPVPSDRVSIHRRRVCLDDVPKALEALGSRGSYGKVIIAP